MSEKIANKFFIDTGKDSHPSKSSDPYADAGKDTAKVQEAQDVEEQFAAWYDKGIIEPPDPGLVSLIIGASQSNIVPQCIDAIARNQGGFGIDIEPTFDDPDTPPDGSEDQREILEKFVATSCSPSTFESIRAMRDRDREEQGNGYLEFRTTVGGELAAMNHVPGFTMRMAGLSEPMVVEKDWMNPRNGKVHKLSRIHRFRKYVQVPGNVYPGTKGKFIFFKEFGDPRYLDKTTGEWSENPIPIESQATEVHHSKRYCSFSIYGFPAWAYMAPEVSSLREFSELVWYWFRQGCIGTKLITTSNGYITSRSRKKLQDALNNTRGLQQSFGVLFAEAVAANPEDPWEDDTSAGKRRGNVVHVDDLQSELTHRLVLDYQKAMRPVVRSAYRLPPTYTGEAQEYTRASVITSQTVAEEQVFSPLRREDDAFFNGEILSRLGVWHWKIKSRGPLTTNDVDVAMAMAPYTPLLTFRAVSQAVKELSGIEMQVPNEPWTNLPLEVLRSRLRSGVEVNKPVSEGDMISDEVVEKSALRGDRVYQRAVSMMQGQPTYDKSVDTEQGEEIYQHVRSLLGLDD